MLVGVKWCFWSTVVVVVNSTFCVHHPPTHCLYSSWEFWYIHWNCKNKFKLFKFFIFQVFNFSTFSVFKYHQATISSLVPKLFKLSLFSWNCKNKFKLFKFSSFNFFNDIIVGSKTFSTFSFFKDHHSTITSLLPKLSHAFV